jgi:uncharacterized protein (TIGR02453 family)
MFSPKTLAFLRALKRNNDREWFRARKDQWEEHVRAPMLALLTRLAGDFRSFGPEFICDPKVSLLRIYRDTRFSANKAPLKTHVPARFPVRGLARHEGAGLYIEVAPEWVWIGGGLYMPSSAALVGIREHIASTHPRLHRIVTAPTFRKIFGELTGDRLTRVPRGYRSDHPAASYLQFKQFVAGRELEAAFATSTSFYPEVVRTFKAAVPLVRFLNTPLQNGRRATHLGEVPWTSRSTWTP